MLYLKHIKYKINICQLHHRHHNPHHHHHHPDLRGEAGLASLDLSSHQIANKLLGMCLRSMLPNIFNNTTTTTPHTPTPCQQEKKKTNPNNSLLLPVPSLPLRDKWPSLGENFAMSGQKYFHIFCDLLCVWTLGFYTTITKHFNFDFDVLISYWVTTVKSPVSREGDMSRTCNNFFFSKQNQERAMYTYKQSPHPATFCSICLNKIWVNSSLSE